MKQPKLRLSAATWYAGLGNISRTLRSVAKLSLFGLLSGVVAAMLAVVGNSPSMTLLAVALALASVEVMVLTKAACGFTSVVIPVLVVNGVLLSSLFFWNSVDAEAKVSIRLHVTEEYQIQAAVIGIVFSMAYTLGALLAGPRSVHMPLGQLGNSIRQLGNSVQIPSGPLVCIGYAGIITTVYAYQGALLQGRYLEANGPNWAVMLSIALTPLSMLALCLAAAKPGPWRVLAIVGVGLWFLILFGRATRRIAALPTMVVLAGAVASGRRVRTRYVIAAAVATVVLAQLPLVGRANRDGVGIIPLGTQLFTRTDELFAGFSLNALLGNILQSGPLTAVVAHRPIQPQTLWISVNPMPGAIAGWPEIQDSLRLNPYTPYNGLGELGAHGWFVLMAVAAAVGFALSLSSRIASSLRGAYALTAMMIVLVTITLFSVTILQYNLRSSLRFVWYALFGVAAIWFAHGFIRRQRVPLEDQRATKEAGVSNGAA